MPKEKNSNTNNNKDKKSSLLQAVISAGMSLYQNKDKIADKVSTVYSNIYGEEKDFDMNEVKGQFTALGRLAKAYTRGEYRNVSPATFFKIVTAIAYAALGDDLIPDSIPGLGQVDDIAMLSWALGGLVTEIQKFEEWEAKNPVNSDLQLQTV